MKWYQKFAERERAKGTNRVIYDRTEDNPYLERFYLVKRRYTLGLFTVCIHRFWRSDSPTDGLHDHPWPWFVYILSGGYWEHRHNKGIALKIIGSINYGRAKKLHRIELFDDEVETWTIFIMGPRIRKWGFLIGDKWYPWEEWIKIRNEK